MEVILTIKGGQTIDGESNELELVTEGVYKKEENEHVIVYKETEITGMGDTLTTIKINKDIITLTRVGEINSEMRFKQGEKNTTYYEVESNPFTVSVFTKELYCKIDDKGGELLLDYLLTIDNSDTSINKFSMLIRKK